MIEILLVDDHLSVREGTKSVLEKEPDMLVTVASTGMEALELINSRVFDIMLFDLNMDVINGLELTRRVISINSDIPVLIYTGYDIESHFNLLIEAGVSGFVSKTASREQLIMAIRFALRGDTILPISLLRQLRRKDIRPTVSGNFKSFEDVSINEQEERILIEVALGKSNKEIAKILLMSQRTIEYNLTRIFGKLGVKSRAEAILEAKRLRLIPDEEFLKSV